jgi:hypothetical protein
LWRAEGLLDFNRDYQTAELAPALFLIGSNGGGEEYAFDRTLDHLAVSTVPFIGMDYQYIERLADSFSSFVMPMSSSTKKTRRIFLCSTGSRIFAAPTSGPTQAALPQSGA